MISQTGIYTSQAYIEKSGELEFNNSTVFIPGRINTRNTY